MPLCGSATRLVGLREPPAITLGRSTLCSCCVSSRQLLIVAVDVIIINCECIRREERTGRRDGEENHEGVGMIVCWGRGMPAGEEKHCKEEN